MKKARLISFRANENDMRIMEELKEREGGTIRKVTDADVLRYGLSLIDGEKKYNKKNSDDVIHVGDEVVENTGVLTATEILMRELEPMDSGVHMVNGSQGYMLQEQRDAGCYWLNDELLDKNGFPVEELSGDVVTRGGVAYVTDPGRSALKEKAKENAEKILVDTEAGRMNPAMASILGEQHSAPGMLTQLDGVDGEYEDGAQEETDLSLI